VHYVAVIGLHHLREDGEVDTDIIVAYPHSQAGYVTDVLLDKAPQVLADIRDAALRESADENTD
jgi:hypothetical protein